MSNRATRVHSNRRVDPGRVVERYQELRNLERTGREFGISRERVRQIVNRAGIDTARVVRPKPGRPERLCKQCGASVHAAHAIYCETHRTTAQKARRRYQRLKANPEKYAQWRRQLKTNTKQKRDRKRAADLAGDGDAATASHQRLQALIANAPVALFTLDPAGTFTLVEGRALTALSLEPGELIGRSIFAVFSDLPQAAAAVRHALQGHAARSQTQRGGAVFELSYTPVPGAGGAVREVIGVIIDVTDRARAEEALHHQALHDALTGLPNRSLLYDRLGLAVALAARAHQPLALLLLDLDRFKEVNDTFGHHYGDLLLQQVGQRLRHAVRTADTVARLGGDEFALLLPGDDRAGAVETARKIGALLEAPFLVDGHTVRIDSSIGIALYPAHGQDGETLLRHADVAMYLAKQAHRGVEVYAADLDHHTPHRLALLGELREAIDAGSLLLHYQPIVDLASGDVTSVEALVRWPHPGHGLLPPEQFIPLAESSGQMARLTRWVLATALRQAGRWRQAGITLDVTVNISMSGLHDPGLAETIATLAESHAVPPGALRLEITESTLMMDATRTLEVLTHLARLAVPIAVDDFGTGYSSLAYLKRLPVDTLKIDRSFVLDMVEDEADAAIVTSTISLGHGLGLRVVAEGVEDRATRDRLVASGCDAAQGHYFSRPLPADRVADSPLLGR